MSNSFSVSCITMRNYKTVVIKLKKLPLKLSKYTSLVSITLNTYDESEFNELLVFMRLFPRFKYKFIIPDDFVYPIDLVVDFSDLLNIETIYTIIHCKFRSFESIFNIDNINIWLCNTEINAYNLMNYTLQRLFYANIDVISLEYDITFENQKLYIGNHNGDIRINGTLGVYNMLVIDYSKLNKINLCLDLPDMQTLKHIMVNVSSTFNHLQEFEFYLRNPYDVFYNRHTNQRGRISRTELDINDVEYVDFINILTLMLTNSKLVKLHLSLGPRKYTNEQQEKLLLAVLNNKNVKYLKFIFADDDLIVKNKDKIYNNDNYINLYISNPKIYRRAQPYTQAKTILNDLMYKNERKSIRLRPLKDLALMFLFNNFWALNLNDFNYYNKLVRYDSGIVDMKDLSKYREKLYYNVPRPIMIIRDMRECILSKLTSKSYQLDNLKNEIVADFLQEYPEPFGSNKLRRYFRNLFRHSTKGLNLDDTNIIKI